MLVALDREFACMFPYFKEYDPGYAHRRLQCTGARDLLPEDTVSLPNLLPMRHFNFLH